MATIVAAAGGGAWNVGATWVGGVAPTAADDAQLTAASGNVSLPTATTVACRSLDCTGYTGTLTWASTTAQLNVGDASGGACKFVAGMTVTLTGVGFLVFVATTASTTYTLTTGGKTLPNVTVATGTSTTIQLADNLTSSGLLRLTSGVMDTNGKTVTGVNFRADGSTARTLTFGASALTFSGASWNVSTITNLTITANTATVTYATTGTGFDGGGANYNGLSLVLTGAGDATVTGSNTFANLTRTGPAAIDGRLVLAGNQTITNVLTLTGNSGTSRLWVLSSVPAVARTLTVNGSITASRVDFEDIVGAGSASWNLSAITEGSGDIGGNSGITFTTPVTLFGRAAGNWATPATWSLTSGGSAATRIPLPQDTMRLDANSGAGTYTMNMHRHGKDIDCTGFTGTLSLASSATARYIFGSLTLSSGMTFTATGNFVFAGRGTHTIDMAGKAFTAANSRTQTVGRFGGTYTLTSDASFGNSTVTTASGLTTAGGATFTANGFNITSPQVSLGTSTVNMGAGTWTLTSGDSAAPVWAAVAGTTLNAGTSNIVIASATTSGRTFAGANGKVYYDLTYTVAGSTGSLTMGASNTFHDLNFSDASNARSLIFFVGTTTTITGAFNVFGTAGKLITIASTSAANHTLAKASGTVNTVDYVSLSRSQAGGGAAWYAGANSTDGGNNTGWIFTAAPSTATGNFFLMFAN